MINSILHLWAFHTKFMTLAQVCFINFISNNCSCKIRQLCMSQTWTLVLWRVKRSLIIMSKCTKWSVFAQCVPSLMNFFVCWFIKAHSIIYPIVNILNMAWISISAKWHNRSPLKGKVIEISEPHHEKKYMPGSMWDQQTIRSTCSYMQSCQSLCCQYKASIGS